MRNATRLLIASLALLLPLAAGCSASSEGPPSDAHQAPLTATTLVATSRDGKPVVRLETNDGASFDVMRAKDGLRAVPAQAPARSATYLPGSGAPATGPCNATSGRLYDDSGNAICFDDSTQVYALSDYCRTWAWVHAGSVDYLQCTSHWFDGRFEATYIANGSQVFCLSANPFLRASTLPPYISRPATSADLGTQMVWVQPSGVCPSLYDKVP